MHVHILRSRFVKNFLICKRREEFEIFEMKCEKFRILITMLEFCPLILKLDLGYNTDKSFNIESDNLVILMSI